MTDLSALIARVEEGTDWQPASTSPHGIVVETKIDDEHGIRNQQKLLREGNLWFVPDRSMYVYYRPTHWKRL